MRSETHHGYAKPSDRIPLHIKKSGQSLDGAARSLIESCRGEMTHWLPIFLFWVFGFIVPPYALVYMLIYALVANLPCIIVQRYNRPRILKILVKISLMEGSTDS